MKESRRLWLGASLAAAALLACDVKPPPSAPARIEFSGCRAVRRGPVCEIAPDTTLRLAVRAPPTSEPTIRVTVDGKEQPVRPVAKRDWRQVPVVVKAGAREVALTVGGGPPLLLKIASPEADAASRALAEAESLRRENKLLAAKEALQGAARDGTAATRARARGKLARIETSLHGIQNAAALFAEAIDLDSKAGLVSDEVNDRCAFAFNLTMNHQFAVAAAALDGIAPLEAEHPEGRVTASYYRGFLAYETGNLRRALRFFAEHEDIADRLGSSAELTGARQLQAEILSTFGRARDADALFRGVLSEVAKGTNRCVEAKVLNNYGWLTLRTANEARGESGELPDPLVLMERALALYRKPPCNGPHNLSNMLTHLALAELGRGRAEEARHRLEEAQRVDSDAEERVRVWWPLIEARVATAAGRVAEALRSYEETAALAERSQNQGLALEAAIGRAESLDALGRVDDARLAYAAADAQLEQQSSLVPLGEGKDTFFAAHERGTRLRVELLLRYAEARLAGSPEAEKALEEAATAARRSTSRVLRAAQWVDRMASLTDAQRAHWQRLMEEYQRKRAAMEKEAAMEKDPARALSADKEKRANDARAAALAALQATLDEARAWLGRAGTTGEIANLPLPADGELFLVHYPVRDGWVGFAITSRGITARRLGAIDLAASRDQVSTRLLAPFRHEIDAAKRIRFTPYGPLQGVDFHALPWGDDGAPLLLHAPVVYGVDLARRDPGSAEGRPRALLVIDPSLPAARERADANANALELLGFSVASLKGDRATHDAVRGALARSEVRLFHFAGHGEFGGIDGMKSGLRLAADATLTIDDIMTLERVPESVVLSSCKTARTSDTYDTSGPPGLGLAQAFLAAGAGSVIAATCDVRDGLAEQVTRELYAHASAASFDAPAALRDAQITVRKAPSSDARPGCDWAAFRVLVP